MLRTDLQLSGGINTYAYVGGNPISKIDPLGLWEFQFDAGAHFFFPFTAGAAGANFNSSYAPGQGTGDYNGVSGEYVFGSAADIGASAGIGGLSGCKDGEKKTLGIGLGRYGGIQLNFVNGHFDGVNFGLGLGLSLPVTYTVPLSNFLDGYGPLKP